MIAGIFPGLCSNHTRRHLLILFYQMLTEQDQLTPQTQPNPIAVLVLSTVTQVFQTFNPPWPQFENMMVVIFPGLCVNHTRHHLLILFYQLVPTRNKIAEKHLKSGIFYYFKIMEFGTLQIKIIWLML